jgi:hypothetical protein
MGKDTVPPYLDPSIPLILIDASYPKPTGRRLWAYSYATNDFLF